jgi:hypothetical protein
MLMLRFATAGVLFCFLFSITVVRSSLYSPKYDMLGMSLFC